MGSRLLPAYIEDLDDTLRTSVPFIVDDKLPTFRVLDVCRAFRRRGIGRFLTTANPLLFFADAHRSASVLVSHLETSDRHRLLSSRADPWFDAIASGDAAVVAAIARRASVSLVADLEYEEDFCYMRFLFDLASGSCSKDRLERLVARQFELDVHGGEPRAHVCRALLDSRTVDFIDAFERLLEQREHDYESGMEKDQLLEIDWSTEGQIFVEGVALLRLAALRGIETVASFRFVPDLLVADTDLLVVDGDWARPDDVPRKMIAR